MAWVPQTEAVFYPSLLGAVLIGIGIALLLEVMGRPGRLVGLGLGGAVAINLVAGLALAAWLAGGELRLSVRGAAFLWTLVVLLVAISLLELGSHLSNRNGHGQH